MPDEPLYMICLGCESVVREMTATPCPSCRRCAFCGQRIKNQDHCTCGFEKDLENLAGFKAKFGIPPNNVLRERRRLEIRKHLRFKEGIVNLFVLGPLLFVGLKIGDLSGPNTFLTICAMALGTAIIFAILVLGVHQVFRKIEDWRLESEFDAKLNSHGPK